MFDIHVLLSGPSSRVSLCAVLPLGPAVHLCDIFIPRTRMTPQPDWIALCTLVFDLVSSNFIPEELPEEVYRQTVFQQSASCTSLNLFQVTLASAVQSHCFSISFSLRLFRLVTKKSVLDDWTASGQL